MAEHKIAHWDNRYAGTDPEGLSWFEAAPERSLSLIQEAASSKAGVIDVGGGASRLVDALLEDGFRDLTVLDLSSEALARSKARLGAVSDLPKWQVADITRWQPDRHYDLWHDRAVFHFLTDPDDRAAYAARLDAALGSDGTAIIMTFADDGPEKCSGLPVQRYSPEELAEEIGRLLPGRLTLQKSGRFSHVTPGGAEQRFQYSVFRRRAEP